MARQEHAMKIELSVLTKVTIAGLVSVAAAIWTQWLSGDPSYRSFPPGPVFFIAVAAIVAVATRWWWTPLIAALIALFVASGWFARLPANLLRLSHPGAVGGFAPGVFAGTLLLILALLTTAIAAIIATVQNYRRMARAGEGAKIACQIFGVVFVLVGLLMMGVGSPANKYHNLMHLVWGGLAIGASFLGTKLAARFCIASGAFYLGLASLGLLLGSASMNRAWSVGPMLLHTGDHIFHLVIGSVLLGVGLFSERTRVPAKVEYAPS
jgi:hypothetical protein